MTVFSNARFAGFLDGVGFSETFPGLELIGADTKVGSHVGIGLAKFQLQFRPWSSQTLQSTAGMAYPMAFSGLNAAEAMRKLVAAHTTAQLDACPEDPEPSLLRDGRQHFGRVVVLCQDTLLGNAELFEAGVAANPNVDYFVDIRALGGQGVVYSFDPNDADNCELYRKTLGCAEQIPPGMGLPFQTAFLTAAAGVSQVINFAKRWHAPERELANSVYVSANPPWVDSACWTHDAWGDEELEEQELVLFDAPDPLVRVPERFVVLGAGATGSQMCLGLAEMYGEKCPPIEVFDFDTLEGVNGHNTGYEFAQLLERQPKVEALRDLVTRYTGRDVIVPRFEEVEREKLRAGTQSLGPVLILCPDSMEARRLCWEERGSDLHAILDTRMARGGMEYGGIKFVDPSNPVHARRYGTTFAEVGERNAGCAYARQSLRHVASMVVGSALTQLAHFSSFTDWSDDLSHTAQVVTQLPSVTWSRYAANA